MSKLLHSEQQLLRDWGVQVRQLFNKKMPYQVGTSVYPDKPHRDIDVRVMLSTEDLNQLQKILDINRLNLAVSLWGQQVTNMPIDFQVQDAGYANEHHAGPRKAIGLGYVVKGDGYENPGAVEMTQNNQQPDEAIEEYNAEMDAIAKAEWDSDNL